MINIWLYHKTSMIFYSFHNKYISSIYEWGYLTEFAIENEKLNKHKNFNNDKKMIEEYYD